MKLETAEQIVEALARVEFEVNGDGPGEVLGDLAFVDAEEMNRVVQAAEAWVRNERGAS